MFGVLESCGQQNSIISFHMTLVKQTALLQSAVDPVGRSCLVFRKSEQSRGPVGSRKMLRRVKWQDGLMGHKKSKNVELEK